MTERKTERQTERKKERGGEREREAENLSEREGIERVRQGEREREGVRDGGRGIEAENALSQSAPVDKQWRHIAVSCDKVHRSLPWRSDAHNLATIQRHALITTALIQQLTQSR